jgi:hypothetical protein
MEEIEGDRGWACSSRLESFQSFTLVDSSRCLKIERRGEEESVW